MEFELEAVRLPGAVEVDGAESEVHPQLDNAAEKDVCPHHGPYPRAITQADNIRKSTWPPP